MPPQPAPLLRVDRQGTHTIKLGRSITDPSSTYQSVKCIHTLPLCFSCQTPLTIPGLYVDNFKPNSSLHNPSSPTLKPGPSPSTYSLTFTPSASAKIQYTGTGSHPPPRRQHFLLYDPATKELTLEKLDTALVFNADVFASAHPPIPREVSEDEDEDSDADAGGAYDFHNFLGKTKKTAAEEKQEKRLQALKRAGRTVVEVADPEPEPEIGNGIASGTPLRIPDRRHAGDMEIDSEADAPGEDEDDDDDDVLNIPSGYTAAPPRPARAPAPAPTNASQPAVGLGLEMSFEYEPTPPREPDELVLPDPVVHGREDEDADGEEELEFSDEDEDVAQPAPTPAAAQQPPPQAAPEDDEVDDFDFLGNELEAALGGTADGDDGDGGLIMDDDDDEPHHHHNHHADGNVGSGPRSLIQNQGGYLDDSSESEEE